MTNLLLTQTGHPRFTWGQQALEVENATRKQYIDALRMADQGDYTALALFVRS